jgi:Domain of unknown function (DUF1707)
MTGPGDQGASAGGRGGLRASHADREHVISTLRTAFVQGRLTEDEFGARVDRTYASRTYAELAEVVAGIPAALTEARSPGSEWRATKTAFPLVVREAGVVRRIEYGLGVAAVAVAAALAVRYVWAGAHAGRDAGWDKARLVLLVGLLAGLPWVARRREVFGPVGRSIAARVVRVGGCAALVALVLDIARIEHFPSPAAPGPWPSAGPLNWVHEGVALALIAACLIAVLVVPVRWPQARPVLVAWCAVAAGLLLFFTVAPLQVLIAFYAAGILAVTSRRSPVTPATLAISAAIGVGGGLLVVALWNPTRTSPAPGLHPKTNVLLLFIVLVAVIAAGTAAAATAAARRTRGMSDPPALQARAWQCLAAGPLTAATAALMLPLLRASAATHIAAMCPVTKALHPGLRPFLCTVAPSIWMFFLIAGPVLGLAIGSCCAGAITSAQPPTEPPPPPPREPRPVRSRWGGVFVKM